MIRNYLIDITASMYKRPCRLWLTVSYSEQQWCGPVSIHQIQVRLVLEHQIHTLRITYTPVQYRPEIKIANYSNDSIHI